MYALPSPLSRLSCPSPVEYPRCCIPLRGVAMLCRLSAFLACTLALTSCLVTYKDFPSVDRQSSPTQRKTFPIYYHVNFPSELPSRFGVPFGSLGLRHELERAFEENQVFADAIIALLQKERGIYCAVAVTVNPRSVLADWFLFFSGRMLLLLPVYSGEGGYLVRYWLYIDKQLKKTYRYEITEERLVWLGLLPFVWVNFFTASQKDAFLATAHQFFHDAELDGYFDQS